MKKKIFKIINIYNKNNKKKMITNYNSPKYCNWNKIILIINKIPITNIYPTNHQSKNNIFIKLSIIIIFLYKFSEFEKLEKDI